MLPAGRSSKRIAPLLFVAALTVARVVLAADDTIFLKNGKTVTGKILAEDTKKGVLIELKDGKKKTFRPREITKVIKAPPPEPPKKNEPPRPPLPPAAVPEEEPEEAPPPPTWHVRKGLTFGFGLDGALVRAKSLGPQLGLHGIVEVGTGTPFYVRAEPGLSYWTRSTAVNALSSITPPPAGSPDDPSVIERVKITNNVRVLEGHVKLLLGFDIGQSLSIRAGGLLGYARATTDATQCTGGSNSGLLYGGTLVPLVFRALEKKQLEVGANVDYQLVPVPKCDVPVSGTISVKAGDDPLTFDPALKKQRVGALFFGLHLSYLIK